MRKRPGDKHLRRPSNPLFNFRNTELIEIAISLYASATSINCPDESSLQLGPIRATPLIEPLIGRYFKSYIGGKHRGRAVESGCRYESSPPVLRNPLTDSTRFFVFAQVKGLHYSQETVLLGGAVHVSPEAGGANLGSACW